MPDLDFDFTLEHPTHDFKNAVTALARARQDLSDFERENARVLMQHQLLKNIAKQQEEDLRTAALQHYQETGEVSPHDAVRVKMMKRIVYDDDENFKRALERREESVLQLNTTAIKKLDADWIVYEEKMVPTPHIQSKLGEYLILGE